MRNNRVKTSRSRGKFSALKQGARHANIPVFIPHRGCPNTCVFCDQRAIAGQCGGEDRAALVARARAEIDAALATCAGENTEIAYFGGSFTGIDRATMLALLDLASDYVADGRVCGIRCSTRPDYVGEDILDLLARYPMTAIELGVQSLDDAVLAAARRGHTAACALDAIARLRARGFSVVGQMMLGLPGSSAETELATADALIAAGVDAARIYPTLVLRDTPLADCYAAGDYAPLNLDEAVALTATLLERFAAAGIDVLRVGLQQTDTLPGAVLAGPIHPAFGELALGEVFRRRIADALAGADCRGRDVTVAVPAGRMSAAVGQKKRNIFDLSRKFTLKSLKVIEMDTLLGYNIMIDPCVLSQERKEERDPCI